MEFLGICAMAFLIVFAVLAALGFGMRLIMWAFPAKPALADAPRRAEKSAEAVDAACWAAIAVAMNSAYPGLLISRIEEIK
jgi:hypothetical protein